MIIAAERGTGVSHELLKSDGCEASSASVEMKCRSRERKQIYSARGLYVVAN